MFYVHICLCMLIVIVMFVLLPTWRINFFSSYTDAAGSDRVDLNTRSTMCSEMCRCQLPAWNVRLLLALCVIVVIGANCVTLVIGHKFNAELALRWIVVCLAGFVVCVVCDTIRVCFTTN